MENSNIHELSKLFMVTMLKYEALVNTKMDLRIAKHELYAEWIKLHRSILWVKGDMEEAPPYRKIGDLLMHEARYLDSMAREFIVLSMEDISKKLLDRLHTKV